jgi:hypothetical protein
MYPHLAPHGLILKLNREPLTELNEDIVRRDHEYWTGYAKELIGDWLTPATSVETVCAFSKKVYLNKDLGGFTGDADYARNERVQKSYTKLRVAIAEVYSRRAIQKQSRDPTESMSVEADFAFKQALALGPVEGDVAERYARLLTIQGRRHEALQVAQTYKAFNPKAAYARELIEYIQGLEAHPSTNQPSLK